MYKHPPFAHGFKGQRFDLSSPQPTSATIDGQEDTEPQTVRDALSSVCE